MGQILHFWSKAQSTRKKKYYSVFQAQHNFKQENMCHPMIIILGSLKKIDVTGKSSPNIVLKGLSELALGIVLSSHFFFFQSVSVLY